MRSVIIGIGIMMFTLTSCAKEWSQADQNTFLNDCKTFAQDNDAICNCGLEKAMERYTSLKEAQDAIQKMEQRELEEFFAECL